MAGRGKQIDKQATPFPNVKLILFERSPYWWVRIWDSTKRQSFFRSTETADSTKAMKVLAEIYQTFLSDPDALRTSQSRTVSELIDKFVEHHEERVRRHEITQRTWDSKKSSLKTGLLTYLIEFSLIRARDLNFKKDFKAYPQWRKGMGYNQSTIQLEVKHIKEFAAWLQKNGYIKDGTCNITVPRQTHQARELEDESAKAFTTEHLEAIRASLQKKVDESEGSEIGKWMQVSHYFELMLEGGFRTDELFNVEFGDIQLKRNGECLLKVRISKTGRRETILMTKTIPEIRNFLESKKVPITKETSLWINPGTHQKWSKQFFTRRFRLVLEELGMEKKDFRLYSCRATHITKAIERQVSTYLLAKNLGTSETMINRYYEDVKIQDAARALLYQDQKIGAFDYSERKQQEDDFEPAVQ